MGTVLVELTPLSLGLYGMLNDGVATGVAIWASADVVSSWCSYLNVCNVGFISGSV